MDLINSKLCPLNLSAALFEFEAGPGGASAKQQTFCAAPGLDTTEGLIKLRIFFFPLPSLLLSRMRRSAAIRVLRSPSRRRITKLSTGRHFALLSPRRTACFVLLAFARFSVNTDITH